VSPWFQARRGQPRVGELAEHQVGEFPEHFSLGLGEFIERRQSPGVRNVYVGVERKTGRATVVSTWDTLEHANFVVPPDFIARMQELGMQGERPVIYEVTDQF